MINDQSANGRVFNEIYGVNYIKYKKYKKISSTVLDNTDNIMRNAFAVSTEELRSIKVLKLLFKCILIYNSHLTLIVSGNIMKKINLLNVGCGSKFHKDWTNVDMASNSPYVKAYNILIKIPYPDNCFDGVYHSQVLEHIPKANAFEFMKECYRVLKPGGVLRVVCPDLENICKEYLRLLELNISNPSKISIADYDWIMLEMFDQTVRNEPGGEMVKFMMSPSLENKDYIIDRIGYVGRSIIESGSAESNASRARRIINKIKKTPPKKIISYALKKSLRVFQTNAMRIGSFRLGGEIHMWMYDRFSLTRLLLEVGFVDVRRLDAHNSSIPDFGKYELDVKDGEVFDPKSLFIEARKPD